MFCFLMSEEKEAHQTFPFNTIIIVSLIKKIMSSEEKCGIYIQETIFDVVLFPLGIIFKSKLRFKASGYHLVSSNFSCRSYNTIKGGM